jgi:formate--tetrahydrofolate ligase
MTKYLSDLEIAQANKMLHIREIAAKLGIEEDDLEIQSQAPTLSNQR